MTTKNPYFAELDARAAEVQAEQRAARARLSYITEPGDPLLTELLDAYEGDAVAALAAIEKVAAGSHSKETFAQDAVGHGWIPRLKASKSFAIPADVQIVIPTDREWPAALDDLANPPVCLWVRGDLSVLAALNDEPSVAIVGARAATSYGENVAMEIAADLARDHIIVSGAAYGIDGVAHRAALTAGGKTVAVLAGGVDRPYPAGHLALIDRIAANGAVVAEVPPGSAPTRWRFLERNRLIAALGDSSLIVEAGARSGSLNEANHAIEIGRPLFAVPGPVTSAASVGTNNLIRSKAATLATCADDLR